jgi:hypothetical protein
LILSLRPVLETYKNQVLASANIAGLFSTKLWH